MPLDRESNASGRASDVDASGHWPGKTVTKVGEAVLFCEIGPEDQDYLQRFPQGCKLPLPGGRQHDNRPASA